ncbi:MAG: PA0069 family radical SAM protein [Marinovum sp.]|nr:PA0069 family radical SAM protein [Marinovum sp.]
MEITKSGIASERGRARGAGSNPAPRFERYETVPIDDGWASETQALPPLRTEVREEVARSIVSYNRSPDISFDRSINPYRGCEHGCVYCFARPSHAYLGLSPGLDFETQLIARRNAAQVLVYELRKPGYRVAPMAIGTNTDPYQPIERDRRVMRACLEVLAEARHPVGIVTKGSLIERDIDILAPMAARGLARVGISVTSLDAELSRKMEPRCPTPQRRLQTIRRLSDAGIPVRVCASPLIPGLTDHEMEAILTESAAFGAAFASWIVLRLPREVADLWKEWLFKHYPDRARRVMGHIRSMHGGRDYDARWHHRMRGEGAYAQMIAQRFDRVLLAVGLAKEAPVLDCTQFKPPERRGDQLSLF